MTGVLVLGKELRRDRPRALRELAARCTAAAIVHRQGAALVMNLEAPLQGQEEAGSVIARRLLLERGVPESRLYLERSTRSTREEAVRGARVARARGVRHLTVITSAYHVPRARAYFLDVLPPDQVLVACPERFLPLATPEERALLLAGAPDGEAMARECKVEALFLTFARALAPLPPEVRWELEVLAGGVYRGIEGLRGSIRSG